MSNPYVLRSVIAPNYFVAARNGRGAQAESILNLLKRIDPPPDSISIVGERHTGKTSLLGYLAAKITNSPGLFTASINMLGLYPPDQDSFYMMLTRALWRSNALPREHPTLDYWDFEEFLWDLKNSNQRLILFIDALDLVTKNRQFGRAFFDILRSLADNIDLPLVLVIASTVSLAEIARLGIFGSDFFDIFFKQRLVPLSQQEALALITQPSGIQTGFDDVADDLITLAGHHPYLLQLACRCAWEIREENGSLSNMTKLFSAFMAMASDHFQCIWDRSSSEEKRMLAGLASGIYNEDNGLNSLIERGYVLSGDPPSLFCESFKHFLLTKTIGITVGELGPKVKQKKDSITGSLLIHQIKISKTTTKCRFALVVGVNSNIFLSTGNNILAKLQHAEQDAIEMANLLEQIGYTVKSLVGAQATYSAIQTYFEEMKEATNGDQHPDNCFVFHFSGHGQLDANDNEVAYLVLHDTDLNNPVIAGLEMASLVYNLMPMVQVPNSLLLLDACHAGFAAGVKHVIPADSYFPNVALQLFNQLRGRMVIAACPGSAYARESDVFRHGIFTYYLLKHWRDLEGPHLPDRITLGSLIDYIDYSIQTNYPDLPRPVYSGSIVGVGSTFTLRQI